MRPRDRRDSRQATKTISPTAIDVFSGGGGLTVGMKKAGFTVVGAVEMEKHAFSTYKANHPEVHAFRQDVRTINGSSFTQNSPTGRIDLVAGCPPCQGFSSLTSKYTKDDPRNELVLEMARIVLETKPKAVMMENVPGLLDKGKHLFDKFVAMLTSDGYRCNYRVLQTADYGIPQSRRRLVFLAGRHMEVPLPEPTHSRVPTSVLRPWMGIGTRIIDMPEPVTLSDSRLKGGPMAYDWHVVRNMTPQNRRRLKHAQPGKVWIKIPKRLRPECHKDRRTGFSNVYGRMCWDEVSPTITGGCTTFSKGRFGHPDRDRTISVREAALLQTFPPDYLIDTPFMDHACNIIGNALPCEFAEIIALQIYVKLQEHESMA